MTMNTATTTGKEGAHEGVYFAVLDIIDIESLIHDRALLKEYLPRRDGGADVGHDDEEQVRGQALRKIGVVEALEDLAPGWRGSGIHRPERGRDDRRN